MEMVRDKTRCQLPHQKMLLLVSLSALAGFLLVALFKSNLIGLDVALNAWAASIQTGNFTVLAVALSDVFDPTIVIAISLVVAGGLFVKKHKRYSFLLFGIVTGDVLLVAAAKMLIASPRPLNEILLQSGYSFPSGHVAGTVVFFGFLTYLAWQLWGSSLVKTATGALYVAVVCIVGFDRIYLNVHWLSDVMGASLLGVFWLTFMLLIFRYVETTPYFRAFRFRLCGSKKQISTQFP